MKNKLLIQVMGWVNALLGTDFQLDGNVALTEEQKLSLDKAAKKDGFADAFLQELESSNENTAANDFITEFMQSQSDDDGDADAVIENAVQQEGANKPAPTLAENVQALTARVVKSEATNKTLLDNVAKLAAQPEEDVPEAHITIVKGEKMNIVKHSKTHLFGSAESYNKIDASRPWNQKFAKIQTKDDILEYQGVDWDSTINIEKINSDFGAYSRKNQQKIFSLLRDGFGIPANWGIIANVSDQHTWIQLLSDQITQALKKAWLPKNKNKFIPQKAKIYDKQIDMTWTGWELKKLEKSYLNSLFNLNGSDPYKLSFVAYLNVEFFKQARKEDKITLIKGVHFPADDMQIAGDFMNAMSGLLKLIRTKKDAGEYNAFPIPKLNANNAYNEINKFVASLPHDIRILPQLPLYISTTDRNSYQEGREAAKGTHTDYAGKQAHVEGYANIRFETLEQLEGTGFIFLTPNNAIDVLMDKVGEESKLHLSKDGKRNINAHVDYKLGIRVAAFGAQMADGKLVGFDNQLFFSNDVELLEDVFVPVPSNLATPDLAYHHSLNIGEHNTAPTDITNFLNPTPGKKVFLRGNNDINPSKVKNNANILIGADVVLTSTTELVLIAGPDNKFRLFEQNNLAAVATVVKLAADATTADAAAGKEFITQDNTAATAITDIVNAIKNEEYTITGGSSTNATTIANSGKFNLTGAMTLNAGTFIKVIYNDAIFIESARG